MPKQPAKVCSILIKGEEKAKLRLKFIGDENDTPTIDKNIVFEDVGHQADSCGCSGRGEGGGKPVRTVSSILSLSNA